MLDVLKLNRWFSAKRFFLHLNDLKVKPQIYINN